MLILWCSLFVPKNLNKEKMPVEATNSIENLRDRGGRRIGEDRRKVMVLEFVPDRRSGLDRRMNKDRRNRDESDYVSYLKRNADRYMEFVNAQKGMFFGFLLSLPVWALIVFWIFMKWNLKF
jgi:hypothetical protein